METKQKARKLVEKFIAHTCCKNNSELQCKDKSKKCALIAVDVILNLDYFSIEGREYWTEVKQEIINL